MIRTTILLAAFFALCVPAMVRAQDAPAPLPPATSTLQTPAATAPTPDQVLRFYDAKLTLSDDQKAQLRPIIADRQQKLQDLRTNTSGRPRERLKKLKAIEDSSDAKINAVLTPDQQKKYAELEAQMKEQAKERRQQKTGGD